jgi:hypothetical protein
MKRNLCQIKDCFLPTIDRKSKDYYEHTYCAEHAVTIKKNLEVASEEATKRINSFFRKIS